MRRKKYTTPGAAFSLRNTSRLLSPLQSAIPHKLIVHAEAYAKPALPPPEADIRLGKAVIVGTAAQLKIVPRRKLHTKAHIPRVVFAVIGLKGIQPLFLQSGDKVIQFAASVLDSHSRKDDAAARIGGEEFALLLVNAAEDEAQAIAERIRLAVSAEQTPLPERMTISMGVYTTHDGSVTAEECVQRADEAMYEAKNSGRNRVVIWRRQGR